MRKSRTGFRTEETSDLEAPATLVSDFGEPPGDTPSVAAVEDDADKAATEEEEAEAEPEDVAVDRETVGRADDDAAGGDAREEEVEEDTAPELEPTGDPTAPGDASGSIRDPEADAAAEVEDRNGLSTTGS